MTAPMGRAATFYVDDDASGNEDGSSWTDAFTDLQDGLAAAGSGDQIWVAAGRYVPGATDTFQLKNGVEIYGGFDGMAGTENDFGVRDPDSFLTILSGDIDGDDLSDANGVVPETGFIMGANSEHVVTGSGTDGTAVLNGFTINAGQDDGLQPPVNAGGGLFNDGGSPTLSQLFFSANLAGIGGGMFNTSGSSPTLTSITFCANSAIIGGGMNNSDNSSPTLNNVTFTANSATIAGGMSNSNSSSPTLTNVTFLSNSSVIWGGGMSNQLKSSPTLINVTFSGNIASASAGGMYNGNNSFPTLTNVLFSNNTAGDEGGGIWNDNSSPTLTNVTLYRNSANMSGGGMFNTNDSDPIIRNCIFESNFILTVCGNQICNDDISSVPIIAHSLVRSSQGSGASWNTNLGTDGGGNIDEIALFVDPRGADNTFGTLDDDMHLQSDSPAIDAGNNDHLPPDAQDLDDDTDTAENIPFDLDGKQRVFNSTVDMGAYESQPGILYVDDTAVGIANGNDWTNAYPDLQNALSRAVFGSQIWVAEGVYVPGNSEEDTFQLKTGVEVYGGFEGLPGTEDDFGVRDPEAFLTILSGDIDGDDITNAKAVVTDPANIVGQNTDHVVTGSGTDGAAVLDGFTITAGQADGSGDNDKGGGMINDNGSPTLTGLTFFGNSSTSVGGGMYNNDSDPTLKNCTFIGNAVGSHGGGMYNSIGSDPTLTNCAFTGNGAGGFGGGMMNTNVSDPTLTNCAFSGNSAIGGGGGMSNTSSNPTLTNCAFSGNTTPNNGGGMWNGGISLSLYVIQNSLFWGNSAGGDGPQIFNDNLDDFHPTIANSLVQGGCPDSDTLCTDVIDEDPLFVDADGMDNILGTLDDNLRLLTGSPAIDSGSNTADLDAGGPGATTISDIPTDLDGNPRISNATVDMGVYEFQQVPPTPTYTSTHTETETPTSTQSEV